MKNKVLFILHLPPPVHGSSLVGKYIKDSFWLDKNLDQKHINLSTSSKVNQVGKFPFVKFFRYFKLIFKILIELIVFKPSTVYISITSKGIGFYKDFPVVILAKLFRKKIFLHYHNKGVALKQNNFFDNLLYMFLFRKTSVILLSDKLYFDIKKYVPKKEVHFCPNGIPFFSKIRNINYNKNKVVNILFLSNLIESKGLFVLLNSLSLLKNNGVKFHCNIVGGEGDVSSEQLKQEIVKLEIEDVVSYLGKKYDDDKIKIFELSDIFVFPTFYHNECFPLVLLEAMQFGLPIVSTDEGGILDIVDHNETGFIVKKQNPKELAGKIKWLIENREEAKVMGENGYKKFFNNFTLDVFEKRMFHILNEES